MNMGGGGVHPSNIHREGHRPFDRGYRGTRWILGACTPLQKALRGVYAPRHWVWGHTMNARRVDTPPIFIATGIHHSIGGIGAADEYWEGVRPSNIHHQGYRPLDSRYRGTR